MRRAVVAIAVVATLVGAVTVGARVGSSRAKSSTATTVNRTAGNDVAEAVQVHGHWKIEVTNPDGTTGARREFENAFVGGHMLTDILTRQRTLGPWTVILSATGPGSQQFCADRDGFRAQCFIVETDAAASREIFETMVTEDLGASFRLRGHATAAFDGEIGMVETTFGHCGTATSVRDCHAPGYFGSFTRTDVDPKVPLVRGQQVLVEVTISYS